MKMTKRELTQLIKEEIESAIDEGFMDSLKGAAGALGAKVTDKVQGTGNLAQTVQAQKQITALVQGLAKDGYGGPQGSRISDYRWNTLMKIFSQKTPLLLR